MTLSFIVNPTLKVAMNLHYLVFQMWCHGLNKYHILYLVKNTNIKRGCSINSSVIEEEVFKDLRVWVDCTLKFSKHICYISSSANSLMTFQENIPLYNTSYC